MTIVAMSALRSMACAGALATAVLLSGAGAGIALADPDESPSADGASAPDNPEGDAGGGVGAASDGGESKPDNEPPPSTVGNGREDEKKPPAEEEKEEEEKPAVGWGWPKFKHSLSIPVLRIPTPEEVTAAGWINPEMFFGSIDVPVPSIDEFLSTLSQPSPEPTPTPSFRTQQEAPVLDVTGNGGGYDPMAAETGAPPVYQLPLVVAPAIPIPGISPAAPIGAAASPPPVASSPGAAAGARAPLIKGSVSPRTDAAKTTLTPMSGNATRVGYSRYLSNPTTAQLAAVALPGVAGLMFLTFGGGVIGYRQANSIRFIRTAGAERFLQ